MRCRNLFERYSSRAAASWQVTYTRAAALVMPFFMTAVLFGQTSLGALQDRLIDRPLFLAGQWHSNRLSFDSSGHLRGQSEPVSFTLAGFDVKSVDLKSDKLVLKGHRAGLEFTSGKVKRISLPDTITLTIDTPADGNFEPALKLIFFSTLQELAPELPAYWQPYAQAHLLPSSAAAIHTIIPPGVANASKDVGYPLLIHQVEPEFSGVARQIKYSGQVLVEFEMDEAGKPQHLFLLTPAGLGLDEQALAAVSQYVFKPVTHDGKPIAVVMDVNVGFQSF